MKNEGIKIQPQIRRGTFNNISVKHINVYANIKRNNSMELYNFIIEKYNLLKFKILKKSINQEQENIKFYITKNDSFILNFDFFDVVSFEIIQSQDTKEEIMDIYSDYINRQLRLFKLRKVIK